MFQKVFKQVKFYCTCISHPIFESLRTGLMYHINCNETAIFANFHVSIRDDSFIIRWELWGGGEGGVGGGGRVRVRFYLSHQNFSDPSQSLDPPPHPRQIGDKKVDDPLRS